VFEGRGGVGAARRGGHVGGFFQKTQRLRRRLLYVGQSLRERFRDRLG